MTTALSTPNPMLCLDGYFEAATRLADFGVTIVYTLGLPHTAIFDTATATLHLREGAPLVSHLRILIDMWCRIVIGPEGSSALPFTAPRHLSLIR